MLTFLRMANLPRGYIDREAASIGQSGLYPREPLHSRLNWMHSAPVRSREE
jgi:hypothetical protein